MLDPRIYRMSLVVAALALVVLAFSLTDQPGALRSSLAPAAFNGDNVSATMHSLQAGDPSRAPGSAGDRGVARQVRAALASSADSFSVTTDRFRAHTVDGERSLENVVATRPGTSSGRGSIVVVAPRDLPGLAGTSPTAALLELGRDLGGETLQRTVVLASITGSQGTAGAMRLAATLPGPVDAVIVLGDLASAHARQPVVIPWTTREAIAPPQLRSTLSAALSAQSSVRSRSPGVLDQLAHLAFPLTISEQGPFGTVGMPAVELSLSGERGPSAGAAIIGPAALTAVGRGVLSTISALDGGSTIAAPSAQVLIDGQIVPSWAISLFVLALIIPVALTTIDGVARARRRRYLVGGSLVAVLGAAGPFLAAGLVLVIAHAVGALSAPPGAVGPGAIAVGAGSVAVMAVALLAALGAAVLARGGFVALGGERSPRGSRVSRAGGPDRAADRGADGAAAAMLLVLCVVTLLIWLANPFAAALLVPALHLWLWAIDSDLALALPARLAMLTLGMLPIAGLVVFDAHTLGYGPGGAAWEAVLLLCGHVVSWVAAAEWCFVFGCLVTGVAIVVSAARRPELEAPPVTVRGPATYAGPGSLGGTKSALRR